MDQPIAVIGMGCRFPGGVDSPDKLWTMLQDSRSAWSEVPKDRYKAESFYNADTNAKGMHNHQGGHFLDQNIAAFDASFFGINPLEAKAMDPQQRMQLEVAFEALEDAGMPPAKVRGSNTSVYVSVFNHDYDRMLFKDPEDMPFYQITGNGQAILSNRISYVFDLRGPSMTLDTGCSGGLVALHQACQGLRTGESDMALVGGVNLILGPDAMIPMSMLQFFSNEGKCFTFDERGRGYGRGEGVAAVLLKPLATALRDNDSIRAVIHTTVLNQDGRTAGITLPSLQAQMDLLKSAYAQCGLNTLDTAYVECHGTGTAAGDPIETNAIGRVLGSGRHPDQLLRIGSIKPNIGHLESASGLAGLIKGVLMVEKGKIPPHRNFERLNKTIDIKAWNLKIPLLSEPWPTTGRRQISVNSFGYGGTNAHVVLTNSDFKTMLTNGNSGESVVERPQIIVLSARTEAALRRRVEDMKSWAISSQAKQVSLSGLVYTLCCRREYMPWRWSGVISRVDELAPSQGDTTHAVKVSPQAPLTFVFTGQGAQWAKMGHELLFSQPVFATSIRRSSEILRSLGAGWKLEDELLFNEEESHINVSEVGQPASTALQIALIDLLTSWSIVPAAVVGHSSGEIAAAYAAGYLSHKDAMMVSYHRGFLSTLSSRISGVQGGMAAVGLGEREVLQYLERISASEGKLCVACVNSTQSTTISGDMPALVLLQQELDRHGIFNRRLQVDTAYHSHHMSCVADHYLGKMQSLEQNISRPSNMKVRFISSVTGEEKSSGFDATYWVQNLVSTVRFNGALLEAYRLLEASVEPSAAAYPAVEIGPHSALSGPVKQIIQSRQETAGAHYPYLSTVRRKEDAARTVLVAAGKLFEVGCLIDLERVCRGNVAPGSDTLAVVSGLPPYPWDHSETFWHESRLSKEYRLRDEKPHCILGTRCTSDSPFEPSWRNIINTQNSPWVTGHVVMDDCVFPAAGYMVLAIEGIKEIKANSRAALQYKLRDMSLSKALIIPDAPHSIEIKLSMRPSQNGWHEFQVCSFAHREGWTQHCRGLVTVVETKTKDDVEGDREEQIKVGSWRKLVQGIQAEAHQTFNAMQFYEFLQSRALKYSGPFHSVSHLRSRAQHTVGSLRVAHPEAGMPPGYRVGHIHPATIDASFHCAVPLAMDCDSLMPVHFKDVVISANLGSSTELTVATILEHATSRSALLSQVVIENDNNNGLTPLMSFEGMRFAKFQNTPALTSHRAAGDQNIVYRMHWKPDVDLLDKHALQKACTTPLSPSAERSARKAYELLADASFYYIKTTLEMFHGQEDLATTVMKAHHRSLFEWMQRYDKSNSSKGDAALPLDAEEWSAVLKATEESGVEGRMLCRVGRNLLPILQGKTPALSVMLEDDLLYKVYRDDGSLRCYEHMKSYLKLLSWKNPDMDILEIGAGTGGATSAAIDALHEGEQQKFRSYDFTDISSGFFSKAQEKFSSVKAAMRFKKLNIERDPVQQGFGPGTYDLIIAVNVLHATQTMVNTMKNTRNLLKPGGKLVLIEITQPAAYHNVIFGTLPGWWEGTLDGRADHPLLETAQWEGLLTSCSFTGLQAAIIDFPAQYHRATFMVSEAAGDAGGSPLNVQIVSTGPLSPLTKSISDQLHKDGLVHSHAAWPVVEARADGAYIMLDDQKQPLLRSVNERTFSSITALLRIAKNIIWVSIHKGEIDPERGLIAGFARTARAENPDLNFVTLDLGFISTSQELDAAQSITRVLNSLLNSRNGTVKEQEYILKTSLLHIPRLVPDLEANKYIRSTAAGSEVTTELIDFHTPHRHLRLQVGTPGLLDSIRYVDDTDSLLHLEAGELEIEVHAIGVNFRDVLVALDQLAPGSTMAGDCSGIITRVGPGCPLGLKIGARVCAWGSKAYSNQCRVKAASTCLISNQIPFTVAASIPCVFITAYFCLTQLVQLQQGQSILIHSAAGGVGQAAIQISQMLGLRIFATVGNVSKRQLLIDQYAIPKDNIFSSNQYTFRQGIMRLTDGKGVDVVLNSLAGEFLHESWACTGVFGTFIELGKTDIYNNAKLDMGLFDRTVGFRSFDLINLLTHHPERARVALEDVVGMFETGKLKAIKPTTVKPMTEIEEVFRLIQSRKHIGKVVLDCSPGIMVKALPAVRPLLRFNEESSYLITGGTGGLGREICRWMASRGAKSLIAVSRSGSTAKGAKRLISDLSAVGVKLIVYACDISNESEVRELFKKCHERLPPIRGVVHGAMSLKDRTMEYMEVDDFNTALQPKMQGTWALINQIKTDLDFLILLSSCAGIVGNSGQGNYAAANAFQDSVSQCRFPAIKNIVSLDLGMIQGAGYVNERQELVRALIEQGYRPVPVREFLSLLGYAMGSPVLGPEHRQLIIGLEPPGQAHSNDQGAYDPQFALLDAKFLHLRRATADEGPRGTEGKKGSWRARLESDQDKKQIVAEEILQKVAMLTLCNLQELDGSRPLSSLGLDSLISVELRNWLAKTFECKLNVSEILESENVGFLTTLILRRSNLPALVCSRGANGSTSISKEGPVLPVLTSPNVLPEFPLMTLKSTIDKYLGSLTPLVSDGEMESAVEHAREFLLQGGRGEELQQRLLAVKLDSQHGNWAFEIKTNSVYLESRLPLMPFSNYFGIYPRVLEDHSAAWKAGVISWAALEYKNLVESGKLIPEFLKDKALCMKSYRWLFNACRCPGIPLDTPQKWPSQDCFIAMRNGQLFRILSRVNGVAVSITQLIGAFEEVIRRADSMETDWLPILTNGSRDTWAKNRRDLVMSSEPNKLSIEMVERADFVICLDRATPQTLEQGSRQIWHGNGCNRWFDKPVQLVVCDDGTSGFVGEHSMMDGIATRRLNEYILQALREEKVMPVSQAGLSASLGDLVAHLPISATPEVTKEVDGLRQRFSTLDNLHFSVVDISDYGSKHMQKSQYHPASLAQMIVQLAFYRLHGQRMAATYEPVSTETFQHGRPEICRVATKEVRALCSAMTADKTRCRDKHRSLLRTAIRNHVRLVTEAGSGQGIDLHLMGLRRMVAQDEDLPTLFTDSAFERSGYFTVCTTTLDNNLDFVGFYPLVDQGWALSIQIRDSSFHFGVISENPRHVELCGLLKEAAGEIRLLMDG